MKNPSVLDSAEKVSSSLIHAIKLQNHAALIGFDWPSIGPVFDKLIEETAELKAEIAIQDNIQKIEEEFGDLLFVCTNLARHLKIDPEVALEKANLKFEKRFRKMEQEIKSRYANTPVSLAVMEEVWEKVKMEEF